jgi:hypothetical protein
MAAEYLNLPFDEAIAYYRAKKIVTPEEYAALEAAARNQAFTVAGAARDDLLADIYEAVAKGLEQGTQLAEFKKDFNNILDKFGWAPNRRDWRARQIFETNMSTAQAAGRYAEQTDPVMLKVRPFFRYMPSSSYRRRPEHEQWYNLVLPADDPFWEEHYPPNGWGCKCWVRAVTGDELLALQTKYSGTEYPIKTERPPEIKLPWTNPRTGKTEQVPIGIDPGWNFNPGARAI